MLRQSRVLILLCVVALAAAVGLATSGTAHSAGALDHFTVTAPGGGAIGAQTVGAAFDIEITARDADGNTVTDYADSVDITSSQACSAGCETVSGFVDGVLTASVTLEEAGDAATITVNANGSGAYLPQGTSAPFVVHSPPVDHFAVETPGGGPFDDQVAGQAFDVQITAEDVDGDPVTDFSGSVDVTSTQTCSAGCETVSGFSDGVATTSVTLTQAGEGATVTATDSSNEAYPIYGDSDPFNVLPAEVDHFFVEEDGGGDIGTQTAGESFDLQFTAIDAFDNVATGFTGTVDVSSNRACSSGCVESDGFSDGMLTGYSVTLTGAGSGTTITVVDSGGSATSHSNAFTVNPGEFHHFTLVSIGTQTAGTQFNAQAAAKDQFGNTVTAFHGAASVAIQNSVCNPACPTTGAFAAGLKTFPLKLTTASTGVRVKLTASGKTGQSNMFTVGAGAPSKLAFTSAETPLASGTSRNLTVDIQDAFGNKTSSTAAVSFAKLAGTGTVSSLTPAVNAVAGTATKSATGILAGPITIRATSGALTADTTIFTITGGAAHHLAFTSSDAPLSAGTARNLTVDVLDANGNKVDSSASVTFSKLGGTGTMLGLPGSVAAVHGTATRSVTGSSAGVVLIRAQSNGLTTTVASIQVVPGTPTQLVYTSVDSPLQSGEARMLTVQVQDAGGNLVDSSTPVTFAKVAGQGTVTGLGSVAAVHGVAKKIVRGELAGQVAIRASVGGHAPDIRFLTRSRTVGALSFLAGIQPDTTSFAVIPGPAAALEFTSATTSLKLAQTRTLTVRVEDAAGNLVSAPPKVVTFAKLGGSGAVSGLGPASSVGGIATKAVKATTLGPITIRAITTGGVTPDNTTFTITR